MELMEEEVKGYSDSREEEEEEEATTEMMNMNIPSSRGGGGGGDSESNMKRLHQQEQEGAGPNMRKQLDLMELSLGTSSSNNNKKQEVEGDPNLQLQGGAAVEKEHMFDKVVTPSDVGKLNRLVIPKQHAEKYFPLDSSSNDKGLLLNFEDRNGKLWRFRYSYWNSSQSYVMTKGWSRFVKEKKLDAGDIVSFQRGLGDLFRHRLYIDWRRRTNHPPHHHHHHHHDPYHHSSLVSPLFLPIRWGGRLYSLPSPPAAGGSTLPPPPPPPPPPRHHDHFQQQVNYNSHMYTSFHHQHVGHAHEMNIPGPGSLYYLRSTPSASMLDHRQHQDRVGMGMGMASTSSSVGGHAPMIIDSVPVAHHHHHHHHHPEAANAGGTSAGKRLRLFGVNMECASSSSSNSSPGAGGDHHQHVLTMPPNSSLPSSASFGDQNQRPEIRETTSLLFDLDPSLQYHHHHHHHQ